MLSLLYIYTSPVVHINLTPVLPKSTSPTYLDVSDSLEELLFVMELSDDKFKKKKKKKKVLETGIYVFRYF